MQTINIHPKDSLYVDALFTELTPTTSLKNLLFPCFSNERIEVITQVALGLLEKAKEAFKETPFRYKSYKSEVISLAAKEKLKICLLEPESLRVKAAIAFAKRDAIAMMEHIDHYRLYNPENHFKVLLEAAQQSAWCVAEYLETHRIEDPEKRYQLALKAAHQDGWSTSLYFKNFRIDNSYQKYQVALIASKRIPQGLSENISNYFPLTFEEKRALYFSGFKNDLRVANHLKYYQFKSEEIDPIIRTSIALNSEGITAAIDELKKSATGTYFKISKQLDLIGKHPDRNTALKLMKLIVVYLAENKLEPLLWLEKTEILSSVLNIYDLYFQKQILDLLLKYLPSPTFRANFFSISDKRSNKYDLLRLVIACMTEEEITSSSYIKLFQDYLKDKSKLFIVLKSLIAILNSEQLSSEEKGCVVSILAEDPKITVAQSRLIQGIFGFYQEREISKEISLESLLDQLLNQMMLDMGQVPILNNTENKLAKFERATPYFGLYAGKLNTLPERDELLACYGTFLTSILQNTFLQARYNIEKNPHLSRLKPTLLEAWKNGSSEPIEGTDLILENSDDPMDLFLSGNDVESCLKLDGNPDYSKGLLGYLMNGTNRILIVKNKEGKIVARALIRLLIDDGQNGVLFQETGYFVKGAENYLNLIDSKAIDLAESLNIPLARMEGKDAYPSPLHSFGGAAPFEYSDAYFENTFDIPKEGRYTLKKVFIVFR